jgi:hypothetical protein
MINKSLMIINHSVPCAGTVFSAHEKLLTAQCGDESFA